MGCLLTGCTNKITEQPICETNKFEIEMESLNGKDNGYGGNYLTIDIPSNNKIKYATYQQTSMKEGKNPDAYLSKTINDAGISIWNFNIPYESRGYSYFFDIKIYKWENVIVSHHIAPLSVGNLLKSEPSEPSKSVWLTTRLNFSNTIDKNKTVLICNNQRRIS